MQEPAPSLNPALRDFWLTPARIRVLYGGRSSSKSWDAAGFAIFLTQRMRLRFLCTRQFQNKIEESVYTLLKVQIERFGLQKQFKILDNKIICRSTGSEFVFYGLWRHVSEIKSLEGIDVHWAEEAHLLTEDQWKIIDPTLRKEGSQHWIIFNPRLATDFTYQRFVRKPPPDTVSRLINYTENPFLSSTILKVIEGAKAEDEDEFRHIYMGEPKLDDAKSVIQRAWLMAAIDAHKTLGIEIRGAKRKGFDVADAGEDFCATVDAHGPLATSSEMWKGGENELLKSCTRVYMAAQAGGSAIVYDAIGVGAGAGAKFNELNAVTTGPRVEHSKFFAGGSVFKPDSKYTGTEVLNKDFFSNIKAQAWWLVADRLRNTYNAVRHGQKFPDDEMIFIDGSMPNLDQLMDELSTPLRDYDLAQRVKVESKKDLAKRGIASPNIGDAFIMAFLPSVMKKTSFFG
jgi:phage terminase large subunit